MIFDVITFGSAVYDTYVTSKDFHLQKTADGIMLCQGYGSKIVLEAHETTSGGGACNAAVSFERLGLQTGIIACVGRDYKGLVIKEKLRSEGVSLVHLQTSLKSPTSSSIALIGKDGGRTVLVHRAASNLLSWQQIDWDRLRAKWFYLSTLAGNFTLLSKIIRISQDRKIKIAFNPGGAELASPEKLKPYLKYLEILLMNKEEMLQFLKKDPDEELNSDQIAKLEANVTVVTNGRAGAFVYSKGKRFKQAAVKTETVEETGAGDAFGSGFVAGQIHGLRLDQSLVLAAHNAASVVRHIGPSSGLLFWPEAVKLVK